MRSLKRDVMKGKKGKRIKFFYPLCSLLVFVAGWNSCKAATFFFDILILLGLWFSVFFFAMLVVCFPKWFCIEN